MTGVKGITVFFLFVPMLLAGAACSDGGGGGGGRGGGERVGAVATLELDAAYPDPFSFLLGVRELPGGELLAADPLSQVVLRVDMAAGVADTLGRVGGGPGEYRQPDQVFPLPGDSTLLVDLGNGRFTIIGPDGAFRDGMSLAVPREDGAPSFIMPRAVDGKGGLYFMASGAMGQGPPDSTAVVRYDRETARMDTVARLWRPESTVQRTGGSVRVSGRMMEARDDWVVGSDGRVAVLRANGYAVEWHFPDGTVVVGPPNPFESLPISRTDREAYLEESSGGGLMVMVTRSSSGESTTQMSRGGSLGGASRPSVDESEWAETFPPFRPERSGVSPAGEVWVQRWLPSELPQRMDVFDSTGLLAGSVDLPPGSRLIGFGKGTGGGEVAYLVRTDDLGLQWLERHRVVRQPR
jgi:hypothetical protein